MAELIDKVRAIEYNTKMKVEASNKKSQFGSGMRGDKFITVQFQNDKVTNHRNGKTCTAKQFMKGQMDLIW